MDTERAETAYHEAGHAVALYAQGFDVGDASVVQDEDSLGRVASPFSEALADRLDILEYMGEDGEEFMRRRIVVAISGVRALEIRTGRAVASHSLDTYPEVLGSDWSQLNLWLPMLGRVEEWETIMQRAEDEADRTLRKEWSTVSAIAEALLDRGELDAGALHTIFEETGCSRADAPIRRVVLEVERDVLYERSSQLIDEGDPNHEVEGLEQRIRSIDSELETLRQEEDA